MQQHAIQNNPVFDSDASSILKNNEDEEQESMLQESGGGALENQNRPNN